MDEYRKSLSVDDDLITKVPVSSFPELPEYPPEATSVSITKDTVQSADDNALYVSPHKVKLRKYTLKKG